MDLLIEPAQPNDLDAIIALSTSSIHSSWTREAFLQDAELSWSRALVARLPGGLAAFCHYWLVVDEVQILNVATDPAQRRRGYARQLLLRVIDEARAQQRRAIWLEVRRSNLPAQELYASLGFLRVGVRPRYYSEGDEDALVMSLPLVAP